MSQKKGITLSSKDYGVVCNNCGKLVAAPYNRNTIICAHCGAEIELN